MAEDSKTELVAKAVGFAPGDSADIGSVNYGGNGTIAAADLYWMLYSKHPTIQTCANIIAAAVASEGYSLQKGDDDNAKPLESTDPVSLSIREVLRDAWPRYVAVSTFRRALFATSVDLLIFGHSYWLKKRVKGTLVGLERLDARLVQIKPTKDRTAIEKFLVRKLSDRGAGIQSERSFDKYDPKDVVFFNRGGGDTLFGLPSPLEALDLTVAIDLAIRKYRQGFFTNGAKAGFVAVGKNISEDNFKAAERNLNASKAGAEKAFKAWLLPGDWDVKNLANTGKDDVDFVRGTEIAREEVMSLYHVPPGKLLFSKAALGSAGKSEDDATFEEQAVLPVEEAIYETLTQQILDDEFELADIFMVPKRRSKVKLELFESATELVKFGGTGNEARTLVNLPPSEKPGMDDPMFVTVKMGATSAEIGSDQGAGNAQQSDKLDATQSGTKKKTDASKAQQIRLRRRARLAA